jgi:hypothetical protein
MYDKIRSTDYNYKNCFHLACSEIRAAKLAGYCSGSYTYFSGFFDTNKNLERNVSCVRSKANEHLMSYYDHCVDKSITYINSVWDKCYNDNSPVKDFSREKSFLKLD